MINIPSHYNREQVRFFLLGFCYQAGVLHGHRFMLVEDAQSGKTRWITLKNKQHALVDDDTGRVLSGAGGALKGKRFVKTAKEEKGDPNAIREASKNWQTPPAVQLIKWQNALNKASKQGFDKCRRLKARGLEGNQTKLRSFFKKITKDLPSMVIVNFPKEGRFLVHFPQHFFKEVFEKSSHKGTPVENLQRACLILRHVSSAITHTPDKPIDWVEPFNPKTKAPGAKMFTFTKPLHHEGVLIKIHIEKHTKGPYEVRIGYAGSIEQGTMDAKHFASSRAQDSISPDDFQNMPIIEVVGLDIEMIN